MKLVHGFHQLYFMLKDKSIFFMHDIENFLSVKDLQII